MKFSLIIPHYRSISNLKRLLFTIPQKKSLEIIIVDDCSGEETWNILEEICRDRIDIKLFSTLQNSGGGAARNLGLNHATGEYIFFADSDDFFTPALNDVLDNNSFEHDYDIVFFNALSLNSETYTPASRVSHLNNMFKLTTVDSPAAENRLRYLFGEPWCKFIKRSLIFTHNIRFEEIPIHNDTKFSYLCGYHAKKISIDNRVLYCVTESPNSVSKIITTSNLKIRQRVFSEKLQFMREHGIKVSEWTHDTFYFNSFDEAKRIGNNEIIQELYEISHQYGISKQELRKIKSHTFKKSRHQLYSRRLAKLKKILRIS